MTSDAQNSVNPVIKKFRLQNWSLPDSIIYYLTMHPASAKSYQKLIKSCKYFFYKNPILVIEDLRTNVKHNDKWIAWYRDDYKLIDFTKSSSKIWITNIFVSCVDSSLNLLSWIIPRIYQFDGKELHLFDQKILYNEFLFFCSNVENIIFKNSIIKKEDESILTLEELVQVCPEIKKIKMCGAAVASNITTITVKELSKISHFSKIAVLNLYDVPDIFDIEAFFNYYKINMSTSVSLHFGDSISAVYKKRLERILDELIYDPRIYKFGIHFDGISDEKLKKINDRQRLK